MTIEKTIVVSIETLPPMLVGRYRSVSQTPENDGNDYLIDWLAKHTLPAGYGRIFGFDVEVSAEDSQAGKRGYEFWVTLPEGTLAIDGLQLEAFHGGLYATFVLKDPFENAFEDIPYGWKALHEWVIGSEAYQGGQHQWLEEKLDRAEGADLKLYHPIVAKKKPV